MLCSAAWTEIPEFVWSWPSLVPSLVAPPPPPHSPCRWFSVDPRQVLHLHWPSCVVSISSALRCSSRAVTVQMSLGRSDFLRISGRSRRWSFWIWKEGRKGKTHIKLNWCPVAEKTVLACRCTVEGDVTGTVMTVDAYICFPDLCGFLLYRLLERTDVVQQGAVCLHVHWAVRANRVDVHQELLEPEERRGG